VAKKKVEETEEKVNEEVEKEDTSVEVKNSNGLKKIKVTAEQLEKLQKEKKLVGYDPKTSEALIKD
jgi:hypothetical protein